MKVLSTIQLENFKQDIIFGLSPKEIAVKYDILSGSVLRIAIRIGFTKVQVTTFRFNRQAPDYKKCHKCNILKPINELCLNKRKKSIDKTAPLCKSCRNIAHKKRINLNINHYQIYRKEYKKKNKIKRNQWERNRLKNNPILRVKQYLSSRISEVLRGKNGRKTINLIGCALDFLKQYLESKFLPGMTWENYGFGNDKWHVDHIKPVSKFDLSKESEIQICFHYSNLQPLWQPDNLKKHNSFNW
jgi:hypothetical protein